VILLAELGFVGLVSITNVGLLAACNGSLLSLADARRSSLFVVPLYYESCVVPYYVMSGH
jgi:hypothetical protein